MGHNICKGLLILLMLMYVAPLRSQFLMDQIDTTKELGKNSNKALDRFNHIRISGYIQPQFQWTNGKGSSNYSGGDFAPNSNSRFMLRRGRIRFDYARTDELNRNQLQFAFQFDGTERGVAIRDFWGRYWENRFEVFAFTTGMFARPFGYEVNLSSADREAPERGRMSQILMRSERDLGFMVSAEKRKPGKAWKFFKFDIGIFNGQGLTATGEFDSYKDLISQLVIKPREVAKDLYLGGGVSMLYGGLEKTGTVSYAMGEVGETPQFVGDSVKIKTGGVLPRHYYGINAQLRYRTKWGNSELRGEFWKGTQTGTQTSSETPSSIPALVPMYVRPFNGAFIVFLQHIVNPRNQIGIKLDWYDPNTRVAGSSIGSAGSNFSDADIKYTTLGMGYIRYVNENFKLVWWYDLIRNEKTALAGYTSDKKDNVLTIRAQFRF
jgi:hypothetical protein